MGEYNFCCDKVSGVERKPAGLGFLIVNLGVPWTFVGTSALAELSEMCSGSLLLEVDCHTWLCMVYHLAWKVLHTKRDKHHFYFWNLSKYKT